MIKKYFLTTVFTIFIAVAAMAQKNSFQPGWYILEPNAKYFIVKGTDTKKSRLKAGQCLVVFEYDKGLYMCSDGFGRTIAVSGENALSLWQEAGRAGILMADAKASNGSILRKGALYWIQAVDEAGGFYTVKSAAGKTEKVPIKTLMPYATYITELQKGKFFRDSE
jgi:hypothetical protein